MTPLATATKNLLGDQPIGFVDIGARGGVHPLVEEVASSVAVLGFEPDPAECERIARDAADRSQFAQFVLEPAALSDHTGAATLHEIVVPTNNSLLSPNTTFVQRYNMVKWHEIGCRDIETTTLDAVLFQERADETHWGEALKIDTQGTEFEILMGAERALTERTLFLCLEVSFCELYRNQKLFSEIEAFLRQRGFSFYGFDRVYNRSRKALDKRKFWGRERMIQADAYFFRDPLDNAAPLRSSSRRRRLVLATFAALTGYHDFALELLQEISDVGPLRDAIAQKATLEAGQACAAVRSLYEAVAAKPADANVLVGKFIDQHRGLNDYFDVT